MAASANLRCLAVALCFAAPELLAQIGAQSGGVQAEVARTGNLSTSKTAVVSEIYIGVLACANCGEIRVELALYREGTNLGASPGMVSPAGYHLRETFTGGMDGNTIVETSGVWREFLNPQKRLEPMVELLNRTSEDMRFMARAQRNVGTLVLLDKDLEEYPADLPHMLMQTSGERQEQLQLLTEADDGRTVEMKPGEVFLLRLPLGRDAGYIWTSDRPASMALLETGTADANTLVPVSVANATPAPEQTAARQAGSSGTGSTLRRNRIPPRDVQPRDQYAVWQLIAPQSGMQSLRFEYRQPLKPRIPPLKVVTLSVVVH